MKRAPEAVPALRALIAAETELLTRFADDEPKAAEISIRIGRANRILYSIRVDPLRSRTMSPTAALVPAAHRTASDAKALAVELC